MIEWQNESSLFTIRVQGKQWYWVYKYDPNTAQAVVSTPKNIGHNRWRVTSGQESYNADTYYQAIHLAAHLEFQDSYSSFTKKVDTHKKNLNTLSLSNEKLVIPTVWVNTKKVQTISFYDETLIQNLETKVFAFNEPLTRQKFTTNANDQLLTTDYSLLLESSLGAASKTKIKSLSNSNITMHALYFSSDYFNESLFSKFFEKASTKNYNEYYDFIQLDETTDPDSNSRHHLSSQPFRLIKGVINQHVTDILQSGKFSDSKLKKLLLLNTKFVQGGEGIKDKELMPETLWGFRQKRYKRMKKFKFKAEVLYDPITFKVIGEKKLPTSPKVDIAGLDLLATDVVSSSNFEKEDNNLNAKVRGLEDNLNYRISSKINRHRSELVPVTLARRLLRTKRTLVLPAHVNLTVITNSYDVVHSWFIPGLGLKMDCVPGRSTHHTFYIDNIGFYYGQCAEICGRYHHHMPIRLCALPFEHFVVWWQSKGLARMNRTSAISGNKFLQTQFNNTVTREKLIYRMN